MLRISQGTMSVLLGCHSPIHSILVIRAWKKIHGDWPKLWQVACIFFHDIGHWGKDYLDNYEEKKKHWEAGAELAWILFGSDAYQLTAGHCATSGLKRSKLYYADKYSWHLAPTIWLWWNNVVEPKLTVNCKSNLEAVRRFQKTVKDSVESGEYRETHQMYLDRKSGAGL